MADAGAEGRRDWRYVGIDDRGAFVLIGLDRVDELRAALGLAGVAFEEADPDECGCGGPAAAAFRLHDRNDAARVEATLLEHLG